MGNTKGLAIQLNKTLYEEIEKHNMPRNKLIEEAIKQFLIETEKNNENDIPDYVYSEVYNTLYNNEILPLKNKIKNQNELIDIFKYQIEEIKEDKIFLKNQLQIQNEIMESNMSLLSCIKKKLIKSKRKKTQ